MGLGLPGGGGEEVGWERAGEVCLGGGGQQCVSITGLIEARSLLVWDRSF